MLLFSPLRSFASHYISSLFLSIVSPLLVPSPFQVERSGAAQGLAEVIAHLPENRFRDSLLPTILERASFPQSNVRQGYLAVFQYLPEAWGLTFAPYLNQVLPAITKGLSDDTEFVRESALLAGQAIVNTFSLSATEILVPTLEEGMRDSNWRIKQSSIQLLGEFLSKILRGAPGAIEDKNLLEIIGEEHGSSLLSHLWLVRSDTNPYVSGSAIGAWKSVVINTPKTVLSILSPLMDTVPLAPSILLPSPHPPSFHVSPLTPSRSSSR